MAFCPHCGNDLLTRSRFCESCGERVPVRRPATAATRTTTRTASARAGTATAVKTRRATNGNGNGHTNGNGNGHSNGNGNGHSNGNGNGARKTTAAARPVRVKKAALVEVEPVPVAPVTTAWPDPEPAPWETPAVTSPDGGRSGFFAKRTLVFAIPCVVLALALVGSGIYGYTTHNTLNSTKSTLARTRTDLIDANSELHLAQAKADDLNGQLGDTKDRLSASQHRVDLQADQIQNLRTCLDGITTAIVRAGNGDEAGAFSVLDSVKPACQAAQSAIS